MSFAALRLASRGYITRRFSSTAASAAKQAEQEAAREHAEKAAILWRKISIGAVPVLLLATYNAYRLAVQHEEHLKHHPVERIAYDHMYIRKKPFPFGNGDHTLFHNPNVNSIPEE